MTEEIEQILKKVLKDNGYSQTKARRFVCELLAGREPQSMRELAARLDGRIDRASLYRTVKLFERLGLLQRIYIGWKYKVELSDIFAHHHHHIVCRSCGKIIPLREDDEVEALITQIAERHGVHAQSHQLEIQGICANCR